MGDGSGQSTGWPRAFGKRHAAGIDIGAAVRLRHRRIACWSQHLRRRKAGSLSTPGRSMPNAGQRWCACTTSPPSRSTTSFGAPPAAGIRRKALRAASPAASTPPACGSRWRDACGAHAPKVNRQNIRFAVVKRLNDPFARGHGRPSKDQMDIVNQDYQSSGCCRRKRGRKTVSGFRKGLIFKLKSLSVRIRCKYL